MLNLRSSHREVAPTAWTQSWRWVDRVPSSFIIPKGNDGRARHIGYGREQKRIYMKRIYFDCSKQYIVYGYKPIYSYNILVLLAEYIQYIFCENSPGETRPYVCSMQQNWIFVKRKINIEKWTNSKVIISFLRPIRFVQTPYSYLKRKVSKFSRETINASKVAFELEF